MDGRPTPVHDEFDITDLERGNVDALINQVEEALEHSGEKRRNIILAALAELSARYLKAAADTPTEGEATKRKASVRGAEMERHVLGLSGRARQRSTRGLHAGESSRTGYRLLLH